MLSIAKPIKIKVLLHQFSHLMFNLHYIFLFTVFLPDRSISVLLLFLGKCRTVISSRGHKGAKKENKKIPRRCRSRRRHSLRLAFLIGLSTFARIACLLRL